MKKKRTADHDRSRLEAHVYPVIGDRPVASVTLDDAEEVMRRLPAGLEPTTRRHIGQLVARLLRLAVFPLRIRESSPIPAGFLPQRAARKAFAYLYPDEDRRLLEHTDVPFCFRLLWGFLAREGMREGEAFALTWGDLDLKRGAVRLDKNKTDDPRTWALDAGTARALVAYHDRFRSEAQPDELVFLDPQGKRHSPYGAAALLRAHLAAVGLKKERPELFESTPERKQMRVHDLRGTFVTISLANGKSEAWISDRTGHGSSVMINAYKRTARSFEELDAGTLMPLDPRVARTAGRCSWPTPFQRVGHRIKKHREKPASPRGFEGELRRNLRTSGHDSGSVRAFAGSGRRTSVRAACASMPSPLPESFVTVGAPAAPDPSIRDVVETALARALTLAAEGEQWSLVAKLATEIERRRLTRPGG